MTVEEFKATVARCFPGEKITDIRPTPHCIWVSLPGAEPLNIYYRNIDKTWRVTLANSTITAVKPDLLTALRELHFALTKERTRYSDRLEQAQAQLAAFEQRLPPSGLPEV